MFCTIVLLLSAFTGSVFGGFEGYNNTFYGRGAGIRTTEDNENDTFIGFGAGTFNTTGYDNTFIGYCAGWYNTTGYENTFLGYWAGHSNTEGHNNTFLGYQAGQSNTTGNRNTFLGYQAGQSNTTGVSNTFLGYRVGNSNTTGYSNTFLGNYAGYTNATGDGNVFLGYRAGFGETGSNRLYIGNSDTSKPLIYGEFDNHILTINGNLEVIGSYEGLVYLSNRTDNNTNKVSRMVLDHYSNAQLPVYLFGAASTATDNFVAFGGGAPIGNAATQIDLFTAENTTTAVGTPRLTIIGNGYVGIGVQDPMYPLEMASGAHVTAGGVWVNGSSREYKKEIKELSGTAAMKTLEGLNPVTFKYRTAEDEQHVGFIAEDVPDLVATKDRKGLSPMDVVAVLTKVVQEQQKAVQEQQKTNQEQQTVIKTLTEKLAQLEAKIEDLQAKGNPLPILSQK
jgi:hypothetical protein